MLDFDLSLQKGDFSLQVTAVVPATGITGLVGVSGAGKSSLLRALAGLETTCNGRLQFEGDIWLDSSQGLDVPLHRRGIAMVFQRPSLFPHLNVRQNLEYAGKRAGSLEISIQNAIEMLEIADLLTRQPDTLSGGEAQRVAIARALCANPRLLLLDEPLASVDVSGRRVVLQHLESLREVLSVPMIYVSHALDEVARLSDHLMLLDSGQLHGHGPVNEMLTRFDLPLAHDEHAEVLLEGQVEACDVADGVSAVETACGTLYVTQSLDMGRKLRLRIQARDVSVSLSRAEDSSILNILPAVVKVLAADRAGQCLLKLEIGQAEVLARLSQKSVSRLDLAEGSRVFAQIKSVALA